MRRFMIIAAILLACGAASVRSAEAHDDGYGFGYGLWSWSYASAYGRLPYRTGNLPTPPYFSLHPPVYYSGVIVRRPYGDSPFAYTPHRPMQTLLVQVPASAAQPKLIENPYFADPASAPVAPATSARIIVNPFYQPPAEAVAQAE